MAGLTPEEELQWVQGVFAETKQEDLQALESQDAIKKMLAAPEITDYGVYKFSDLEIRHQKYLTTPLRRMLAGAEKKMAAETEEVKKLRMQDETIYRILATICVDAPWNNPLSWATIDARTTDGRVFMIFMDLMKKIGGGEQAIQTFRGKR